MRKLALALVLVVASSTAVQAVVWNFEGVAIGTYNSLSFTDGWFSMNLYRWDGEDFRVRELRSAKESKSSVLIDPCILLKILIAFLKRKNCCL